VAGLTIKDVAAVAGVSTATASRVLSGNPSTSPQSREKVLTAARELDFRPDARARSLRSTRTNVLGLLVPDVRNPFFADLAHAVEQAALASGYSVLLGNADESEARQDRFLETLIDQRVDGVILAPQGDAQGSVTALTRRGIPAIFVDRTVEGLDLPSVTTDGRPGMLQAVAHLAERGHQRIGYIAGPQSISTGRERYGDFTEGMESAGMSLEPELTVFGDFQRESGSAAAASLLGLKEPPTAIIAADSPMAAGAVACLHAADIRIGRDVALVAFDDIDWFSLLNPPLSVIDHSVSAMGETALRLLLEVIDGGNPESVRLPSELVIRDSSAHRLHPHRPAPKGITS